MKRYISKDFSVCLVCVSVRVSLHLCLCAYVSLHPSVSDLAPGQSGVDDMKMLEQKAQQLAAEAEQDKPKPKDKILFVRSDPFLLTFYFISSPRHA